MRLMLALTAGAWVLLGTAGCDGDALCVGGGECDDDADDDDAGSDDDDSGDDDQDACRGIEITAVDSESFASFDYEVVTYEVTDAAPDAYPSLFGERPTFWVIRPADVSPDEALPLIVFHHGGAIGDDSSGEFPYPCTPENIGSWLHKHLQGFISIEQIAAHKRWAVVLPRNEWCDAWQGMGYDDPVDPEHHFGQVHATRTREFVRAGCAGFGVDDERLYSWGTSGGAGAAVTDAYRSGGFDGIIFDSGQSSFVTYWELIGVDMGSAEEEMIHIFGGPPYTESGDPNGEIYDRYQTASGEWEIREGGLNTRLFIAWNIQDFNLNRRHADEMAAAAAEALSPGDWAIHDFDHAFPGDTNHVQTITLSTPIGYIPYALFDFLEGDDIVILEAEDGCDDDACIGEVVTEDDEDGYKSFSGGAGRAGANGEAGLMYSDDLPSDLRAGHSTRVTLGFDVPTTLGLDAATAIGTVSVIEAGQTVAEKVLTVGDVAAGGSPTATAIIHQLESTWLAWVPAEPGGGELRFETTGAVPISLDTVIYLVEP